MPKILIIRFSSIGDIVLTTPVVRCLKQQVKDVQIHYLTKETFAGILRNNPYVHKVHAIKEDISEVIEELRKEKFDCVIDLHKNLRTSQVKMKLHIPSRSFKKLNVQKWLAVNFKLKSLPSVHIVDRYLETLRSFGVVNDLNGLDYFIPDQEEITIQTLPVEFRNGYTAFAIGAQHATKRLPLEKIVAICKKINGPIILLGGREDHQTGEEISKALGPTCLNACGTYSLNGSASLIRQAQQVITHDTGLMHIAAAFKKKIYSVWGSTVPEFGMYPYLPGSDSRIIQVNGLSCRPCSKIGFDTCPKKHFRCMNDVDVAQFE